MIIQLVSVIIPTYNRADTIVRAVRSALDQGVSPIEIVVVDDGSKDNTAQVMAEHFGPELKDGRVRYLPKPNGGSVSARNYGLEHARGEFFAMLDSDDYWLPGKLRRQLEILERHPEVALVWSDYNAVNSDDQLVSERHLRKMYQAFRFYPEPLDLFQSSHKTKDGTRYHVGQVQWAQLAGSLVHTSTVVARASHIARAGQWDKAYSPCEDHEFYFRVAKTGPLALLEDVTTHYIVGTGDQVTTPANVHRIALAYLKIITTLLKTEAGNIRLPGHVLRTSLADGYSWAGQSLLAKGDARDARGYLLKALLMRPNMYTLKLLVGSWMPSSWGWAERLRA